MTTLDLSFPSIIKFVLTSDFSKSFDNYQVQLAFYIDHLSFPEGILFVFYAIDFDSDIGRYWGRVDS